MCAGFPSELEIEKAFIFYFVPSKRPPLLGGGRGGLPAHQQQRSGIRRRSRLAELLGPAKDEKSFTVTRKKMTPQINEKIILCRGLRATGAKGGSAAELRSAASERLRTGRRGGHRRRALVWNAGSPRRRAAGLRAQPSTGPWRVQDGVGAAGAAPGGEARLACQTSRSPTCSHDIQRPFFTFHSPRPSPLPVTTRLSPHLVGNATRKRTVTRRARRLLRCRASALSLLGMRGLLAPSGEDIRLAAP